MPDNIIHNIDVRKGIDLLKDKSIRTIGTSPPYYGLRNYENNPDQLGLEKTPEEYIYNQVQVFNGLKPKLKDDGTLWINIGDSYWGGKGTNGQESKTSIEKRFAEGKSINKSHHNTRQTLRPLDGKHPLIKPKDLVGIPWQLAFALRDNGADIKSCQAIRKAVNKIKEVYIDRIMPTYLETTLNDLEAEYAMAKGTGWYLRQDVVWYKKNPMPESISDRCTKAHEYVFLLSKNKKYFYNQEAILEDCSPNTNPRTSKNVLKQIKEARGNGGNSKIICRQSKKTASDNSGIRSNSSWENSTLEGVTKRNKRSVWEIEDNYTVWEWLVNNFDESIVAPLWKEYLSQHKNKPSVWSIGSEPFSEAHFATFPPELVVPWILAGSEEGDLVCDPYSGAGTYRMVAKKLKRKSVCFEINKKYIDIDERRMFQEFGLFL